MSKEYLEENKELDETTEVSAEEREGQSENDSSDDRVEQNQTVTETENTVDAENVSRTEAGGDSADSSDIEDDTLDNSQGDNAAEESGLAGGDETVDDTDLPSGTEAEYDNDKASADDGVMASEKEEDSSDDHGKGTTEEKVRPVRNKKEKNPVDITALLKDNIRYVILAAMCILALAVILIGVFALKASVVSMCLLVVIQVIIAAMLHGEPMLVNGGVLLCELIAAILTSNIIVIVMAIVLYIAACFAIRYSRSIEA